MVGGAAVGAGEGDGVCAAPLRALRSSPAQSTLPHSINEGGVVMGAILPRACPDNPDPDSDPEPEPEPDPEPVRSAFDGLSANGSTEPRLKLRQHHRRASEQLTRSRGNAVESECDREVKNGNAFHRAPASDLVVPALHAAGR